MRKKRKNTKKTGTGYGEKGGKTVHNTGSIQYRIRRKAGPDPWTGYKRNREYVQYKIRIKENVLPVEDTNIRE